MQSLIFIYVLFIYGNSLTKDKLEPITFEFKKEIQQITLKPGLYSLTAYGAKGGNCYSGYVGGNGGYSYGEISLRATRTLYVVVGGQGGNGVYKGSKNAEGGYNGGGNGYQHSGCKGGAAGGGATSISFVSGILSSLYSSISDILLVAGGGGGAGYSGNGATGGGANLDGGSTGLGKGATLNKGHAFGQGQGGTGSFSGTSGIHAGAGGSGFYGGYSGYSGSSGAQGGGGGSGYANTNVLTNIKSLNGANSGNGYAVIKPLKLYSLTLNIMHKTIPNKMHISLY